eukprot:CAMPEP_0117552046 /NCGR_PEP_ID=MMETSP0784-20121206/49507_1 /TAXON_ID=39447 /ORGANISM="" /LENGTH=131 /DNA_ID=CAMNT_0005349109 /DNA_START=896 /DNA_END=1291 /DNA_ORIENTATION=-
MAYFPESIATGCAYEADKHPTEPVCRRLVIDEYGLEPLSAHPPIESQITNQEPSGRLTPDMATVASGSYLTHGCIEEWETGAAFRPLSEQARVLAPGPIRVLVIKASELENPVSNQEALKSHKIAPIQLMH